MIDVDVLGPAVERLLARPLAAPPPLDAVRRRARSIRTRRTARWVGAVAVVALAVVSVPVLGRDSSSVEVRTVPPATAPADEGARRPSEVESPRPTEGPSVERAPAPSSMSTPVAPPGDGAQASDAPVQPTYEGCRAYARPRAEHWPVATPGESEPECTYRATRPGGYEGSGTWTLTITRNGERLTFDSVRSPRCADTGFIRPGDLVQARLGLDDGPLYASAGEGEWHLAVGSSVGCG
jgi:hypothetical protein